MYTQKQMAKYFSRKCEYTKMMIRSLKDRLRNKQNKQDKNTKNYLLNTRQKN